MQASMNPPLDAQLLLRNLFQDDTFGWLLGLPSLARAAAPWAPYPIIDPLGDTEAHGMPCPSLRVTQGFRAPTSPMTPQTERTSFPGPRAPGAHPGGEHPAILPLRTANWDEITFQSARVRPLAKAGLKPSKFGFLSSTRCRFTQAVERTWRTRVS